MNVLMRATLLAAGLGLLAGCDDETYLPGERLEPRAGQLGAVAEPEPPGSAPISLPAPRVNASWTHEAGGPLHRIDHPALGAAVNRLWSADIGRGNGRKHRITAQPVIGGGRIYTIDSRALVTATSTGGATIWQRDLTPASDRPDDASGGGLALAGNRVYAASGFGTLTALDAATGREVWTQKLGAPAAGAPTVVGDLVYIVSRDNRAWAIDTGDGRVRWQLPGTPSPGGLMNGSGPAVTDRMAIFPFSSGELVAALRQGGVRLWGTQVSGQRRGRAYANVTDISADPVVVGDVIYTGNQSGRAVALDLSSGERIWTANEGAYGPVTVAGGSVFLISDQNRLVRLDAATGAVIWAVELPYYVRTAPRRREAIFAHYGPLLAGGRLLVGSSDGTLRAFAPQDGRLLSSIELPSGVATEMAVAGGTLYIVTDNGALHAYR